MKHHCHPRPRIDGEWLWWGQEGLYIYLLLPLIFFKSCTVGFRQEKQTFPRYDIFILDEVLETVGDIKKMYSILVNILQKKLPECRVQDMFFETDADALRAEMMRSRNENAEGRRVFGKWNWNG